MGNKRKATRSKDWFFSQTTFMATMFYSYILMQPLSESLKLFSTTLSWIRRFRTVSSRQSYSFLWSCSDKLGNLSKDVKVIYPDSQITLGQDTTCRCSETHSGNCEDPATPLAWEFRLEGSKDIEK